MLNSIKQRKNRTEIKRNGWSPNEKASLQPDDPSEVPTPFFASLSASTLADCLTWENERLSFKTDSSTSSITFAKHRGGLHKPNTHRITKKESPSAIMLLRFNWAYSQRSILRASSSASFTSNCQLDPRRVKYYQPKLSLVVPPIPDWPRLPTTLLSKLALKDSHGGGDQEGWIRDLKGDAEASSCQFLD